MYDDKERLIQALEKLLFDLKHNNQDLESIVYKTGLEGNISEDGWYLEYSY